MVTYEEILKKIESLKTIEEKITFLEKFLEKADKEIRKKLEPLLKKLKESQQEDLETMLEGQPTSFSREIEHIKFENYTPKFTRRQEEQPVERESPKPTRVEYVITKGTSMESEQDRLRKLTEFLDEYELLPETGRAAQSNVFEMRQKIRDFYEGDISPEREESLVDFLTKSDSRGNYMINSPPTRVAEILNNQGDDKKYQLRRVKVRT